MGLGVDGFEYEAFVVGILGLSNQIVLQVVKLYLVILLTEHLALCHVEPQLFFLPQVKVVAQAVRFGIVFLSLYIVSRLISLLEVFQKPNDPDVFLEFLNYRLGIVCLQETLLELILAFFMFDVLFAPFIKLRLDGILGVVQERLEVAFQDEVGPFVDHPEEFLVEGDFIGVLHKWIMGGLYRNNALIRFNLYEGY